MSLTVTFEAPGRVWSINERLHWAKAAELRSTWRQAAHIYTRKASEQQFGAASVTCRSGFLVKVALPFRDKRRRDPHNYVGTVVKSIVDGLVDAGLFPDDTPEWVSVAEPTIVVGGKPMVTVEVVPR